MSLLARIEAAKQEKAPCRPTEFPPCERQVPLWVRRAQERRLPAKELAA